MWIKKVITVNWGGLPNREYDFGSVVMLGGSTGSGKSTLEDAIQTVLTAAKHGYFRFNAGQDEAQTHTRGKTPRTVESYVLGGDGNNFARPNGANGYLGIVFANSPNEPDRVVSALLAFQAYLNEHGAVGKGDTLRRIPMMREMKMFTIDDGELDLADLGEMSETGLSSVRPIDTVFNHLRMPTRNFGKVIEHKDKQPYLNTLWGLLRNSPPVSSEESRRSCLGFRGAMAYRPVAKIDQFVKDEILEKYDHENDINNLSESIRNLYQLRAQAERLEDNVEKLQVIEGNGGVVVNNWQSVIELAYVESARRLFDLETERSQVMEEKAARVSERDTIAKDKNKIEGSLSQIRTRLADLSNELGGNPAAQEHERLEETIKSAASRFSKSGEELFKSVDQTRETLHALQAIGKTTLQVRQHESLLPGFRSYQDAESLLNAYDPDNIHRLLLSLSACTPLDDQVDSALKAVIEEAQDIDVAVNLARDALYTPDIGLRSLVSNILSEARSKEERVSSERQRLKAQITELSETRRVRPPEFVSNAVNLLRRELPHSNPRILCDLIEVIPTDLEWQNAIEGFIGANRFIIIVEPKHEAQANQVLINARSKAKLAQGHRLLAMSHRPLPSRSIVHALRFTDNLAKAYLHANYGNVVKVNTVQELRDADRGLMKEGRGCSGYSTFHCLEDDRNLVFGESGREKQLLALQKELADKERTLKEAETWRSSLSSLSRNIDSVDKTALSHHLDMMSDALREIGDAKQRQSGLDFTGVEDLVAERDRLSDEEILLNGQRDKCISRVGELGNQISTLNDKAESLDDDIDRADVDVVERRKLIDRIAELSPDYDTEVRISELDQKARSPALPHEEVLKKMVACQRRIDDALNLFRNNVTNYNQNVSEGETIRLQECLAIGRIDFSRDDAWSNYHAFRDGLTQVRTQLRHQRDHILMAMREKLSRHEAELSHTFAESFCQIIFNDLVEGKEQINALNRVLEAHQFNEDSYRFVRFSVKAYAERASFFEHIARHVQLAEGQRLDDPGVLEEKYLTIYRNIRNLLENSSEADARRELEDMADYRNYHTYDVLVSRGENNQFHLGENATGSGGQTETPFYALRSAALSSAYRINEPGSHHFRVMVVDEAFEKVDETRAAEAIALLSNTLGFQVVLAMPSKNSGAFQPLLSTKFVFTRVPSATKIGELTQKTIVKREQVNADPVQKLWESHLEQVKQQAVIDFDELEPAKGHV